MNIKDVYQFYNEFVKPIYSEIEARRNEIPVELLFETYAAFDHLKRFYLDDEDESKSAEKALSHLKRGVLDAFKLKLKYFNTDLEKFLNSKVDFQLIDNGQFITSLHKDKQEIITTATKARLTEGKNSKEEAFDDWYNVSNYIDKFEEKYFGHAHKVDWAKAKTFKWLVKDNWRGFIIGLVSGCISSYAVWFFTLPPH